MEHKTMELAHWINERYAIYLRKDVEGINPPWTADPVMANVRWCNVHREDDATTRWMRQNWSDARSPVWWFVLGRMLNYIPTLKSLAGCDTQTKVAVCLKHFRDRGEKIFTSAYTISTCGRKMDKIDYVMEVVETCKDVGVTLPMPRMGLTLEHVHKQLMAVKGLGSFLAAQVVADMKNTKNHALIYAPDWWTWSAPGPGSLRGLNWYYHGKPTGEVKPSTYRYAVERCHRETLPFIHSYVPKICMQDWQNCLCEFSKYMKVKYLNGHVRNKYVVVPPVPSLV